MQIGDELKQTLTGDILPNAGVSLQTSIFSELGSAYGWTSEQRCALLDAIERHISAKIDWAAIWQEMERV